MDKHVDIFIGLAEGPQMLHHDTRRCIMRIVNLVLAKPGEETQNRKEAASKKTMNEGNYEQMNE